MRELDGRHAPDGDDGVADAPAEHARDARQSRYEVAHDAARTARALEYRQRVEAEYAAYNANHAMPCHAMPCHASGQPCPS
jgi:hypothetical protein